MVSSIQLSEKVKMQLKSIKKSSSESYEDVIKRLLEKDGKKVDYELLKEGYIEMAEDNLKICKEWEHIDLEIDWEWEDEEERGKGRKGKDED